MSSPITPDQNAIREQLLALAQSDASVRELVQSYKDICTQNGIHVWIFLDEFIKRGNILFVDKMINGMLDDHPDDYEGWIYAIRYFPPQEGMHKGIPLFERLLEKSKNDSNIPANILHATYRILAFAYKNAGNREEIIRTLREGYERCGHAIDYQSIVPTNLPSDIYAAAMGELHEKADIAHSNIDHNQQDALKTPPSVQTLAGQEVGIGSAVLSGTLTHTHSSGEYAFQFGSSADTLDRRTKWAQTPPGLFSEVRDTTLSTFTSWLCYASTYEFSTNPCAITLKWPYANDRNHLVGVGNFTLLYGWGASALPDGTRRANSRMHAIDLRGGKVSFLVKHKHIKAWGGRLVLGAGSFVSGKPTDTWAASQWMMTGNSKVCKNTKNEDWSELSFTVDANPELWSFAANSPDEQGDECERYVYLPLDKIVERHNGNLTICQMFTNEKDIPEGEITLREGRVIYRDWSMLRNGYGAELVSFPGNDRDAALKLTNGQYRGLSDGWNSVDHEAPPPYKFVWKLPEDGQPDGIVLVQNPRYPVLMAQVYLRDGGPNGRVVYAGLANLPTPGFDQPKRTYITIPDTMNATHLEVSLMQGQNADGIGLMGVEVFGKFTPLITAAEPVTVCEDVSRLKPGSNLYYRLVYRDENGITEGEVRTLKIPNDATPILHTLAPLDDEDNAWLVHGNPMGLETLLEVRIDQDIISELPFGRGTYRRHIVVRIPHELYAPGKILSVQAKNPHGASEIVSLTLP